MIKRSIVQCITCGQAVHSTWTNCIWTLL